MKICLLGPSYPYRGGIAHYMTLLAKELRRRRHQVVFLGFTRQYPRWLYPGQTDLDPSQTALTEEYVRVLDSINPWTWMQTARRICREQPCLLILSWWTSFWTPAFWTVSSWVKRASTTAVLFICHNVVEHETNLIKQFCTQSVLQTGDAFIVHSTQDHERLTTICPGRPIYQAFHPSYDPLAPVRPAREEARRNLNVEGKVLLFFGFVRPYKGLEYAIRSLPLILSKYRVTLIVAGEIWSGRREIKKLIGQLGLHEHVRLVDRYIANEEISLYFSAADLLLLPYVSATQSGIAQIAYAQEVPVVATRVGGLLDVVKHGQTGYLVEPASPTAIAEAVIDFFDHHRRDSMIEQIKRERSRFTWEPIVQAIEAVGRADCRIDNHAVSD